MQKLLLSVCEDATVAFKNNNFIYCYNYTVFLEAKNCTLTSLK